MSSTLHFLLLLLTLLFSSPLLLSSTPIIPTHNRRTLHQPFFPLLAFPSPPPQPTTAPPFPKDPSPLPSNHRPFFPVYPSPPPPKPSLPSLPTNLSSLSVPPHSSSRNLLPLVALPATVLLVLVVVLAFLLLHRRRIRRRSTEDDDAGSDSHRLFPPSSTAPDARKLSASSTPPGSEFLYLGTLVNSRGRVDEASTASASTCSPYRKLGSPELRPLPPLPPQVRHADGGCSSEEEFYSPSGGSPGEKGSPGGLAGRLASSSQKSFTAAALGKCASPISTLSSPSYPSSTLVSSPSPSSSPAISSSPGRSTIRSPSSRVTGFWPPPPPDPPRLLRRLTPSPPKRKPLSPSLHSSPPEKDSDRNSRISDTSGQNLHSSETIGDSSRNPFAAIPPPRRTPPPPPPPPSGYWEPRVPKMSGQPPVLLPPRPIGLKNSAAAVFPAEAPEDSNAVQKSEDKRRPKLKPLHWDKVRASSDRAMVWDQLKSSSFELNEEMIETLFICEATNAGTKGRTRQQDSLSSNQENRVLDPKKSQNIAILLRALNVTQEEVCEALLEGNTDSLDNELLETLLKMAPTKEEEFRLKEYKDDSPFKLGPAEKFLKAVLGVPFAFKRLDAMLYIANFESEISYLRKSFETLEAGDAHSADFLLISQAACEELRSSRLFFKLLEAVLKTGNRMNVGTNRGDAQAFKLDTLLKLVDVKGADGNTTLLHFVVQEIIKAEGARFFAANPSTAETHVAASRDDLEYKKLGLRVVSGLGSELHNVTKAAGMDSDVLSSYVSKLAGGIGKIGEVLRLNNRQSQQFHDSMIGFLKTAEDEVIKLQAQQSVAMSLVKEITGFFHGGSAKEEAHPFRIFMVVRDLLAVLDRVCKEVGRINERASTVSTVHCVPMPVNPILPPVFPRLHTSRPGSSDDEGSS